MGKKISLGRMTLKKVTTKIDETEEDEKTTYNHIFENSEGSGKFKVEWYVKLPLRIGEAVELFLEDPQASLLEFVEPPESELQEQTRKGRENQKTVPPKDYVATPQEDCVFILKDGLCSNSSITSGKCEGPACEHKALKEPEPKPKREKKEKKGSK